jgi:WD40 repeat protein
LQIIIKMKTILALLFLLVAGWLAAQGPRLVVPIGHTQGTTSVAFSPDGKYVLTGSYDNTAKLWSIDGQEIRSFTGHTSAVTSVAFSSNGRQILTGSKDNMAKLWSIDGQEIRSFPGHADAVTSVAFSSNGRQILTGSEDNMAKLWSIDGQEIRSFPGHADAVLAVAFSPDDRQILTGSYDKTVKLWSIDGQEIRSFPGHAEAVLAVAFSSGGRQILTGSLDKTAKLWSINGQEIRSFVGHANAVCAVAFSPNGRQVLTGSYDKTAKLWSINGQEIRSFVGHASAVRSVAFSSDGRQILSGSLDKTAKLWSIDGQEIRSFVGHADVLCAVAFSLDGRQILSGSSDKTVKLWSIDGQEIHTFSGHDIADKAVTFSPDGRQILTGSYDKTAKLWSINGQEIRSFVGHSEAVLAVAFSPDGRQILTGSRDKTAKLWSIDGQEIRSFAGHANGVCAVAFSPDGRQIITGSGDKTAKLWSIDGQEIRSFVGHAEAVLAVAFSPSCPDDPVGGRQILTGSNDKMAKLWSIDGQEIRSFDGHAEAVLAVAFSPDGRQILTGSYDQMAKLWSIDGQEIRSFAGHANVVISVAFSPDSRQVLIGSLDKTANLWSIDGQELATLTSIDSTDCVITTPSGLFDASPGAMKLMYYVQGLEVIELEQLKKRYWEPGLLAQIMSSKPLRDVSAFGVLPLYPEIEALIAGDRLRVKLTERSGGMGRLSLFVNGKEIAENINPDKKTILDIDLNRFDAFYLDSNSVVLRAFNAEGWLKSQAYELLYVPALAKGQGGNNSTPLALIRPTLPHLYAIIIGTSDYNNATLKLHFPDLDAEAMAQALRAAGNRLFDDRVHLQVLSTAPGQTLSTKKNIKAAFDAFKSQAKAADILVVYFSGHGLTYGPAENNQFYYLTKDIPDADLRDTAVLKSYTVSSTELTAWVNAIPAQKQVLIFDACNSGSVAKAFEASAAKEFSPTQIRAYDEMKDRTGTFILAGSAADKVSFEASEYGQGLLTYSLLQGMSGAALLDDKRVDVMKLFQYARTTVPNLAKDISQVQTPMMAFPENRKGSSGESFSIGKVDAQTKMPPLKSVKPIFIKPSFLDAEAGEDGLELVQGLEDYFDEQTSVLSYVPVDKFEYGYKISGTYNINGAAVELSGVLKKGEMKKGFKVSGSKQDVRGLVERIMAEVWRLVGGW